MRVKVVLFIAGKVVEEVVEAMDYQDARETALRRNSKNARVLCVTAVLY